MNPILANALQQLRNTYAYPKAYIERIPTLTAMSGTHEIDFQNGIFGRFHNGRGTVTDLWLDAYHERLLTSSTPEDQYLGVASTIYWGHVGARSNHGFARGRTERFRDGPPNAPQRVRDVHLAATSAHAEIAVDACGSALGQLTGVNQISQLPFASKVTMFIDTRRCGAYDNKINRFLRDHPIPQLPHRNTNAQNNMNVAGAYNGAVQAHYDRWCRFLRLAAADLQALGASYQWQCTETIPQRWRAVDVERALFALASLMDAQHGIHGLPCRPHDVHDLLAQYVEELARDGRI